LTTERTDPAAGGFTVLDGAALVAGAAVAAVHIRGVIKSEMMMIGPGWVLVWGTFFWVALTAAGPFLYLVRRYVRRAPGYPRVGDRLWATLGLPWLLAAALQRPPAGDHALPNTLLMTALTVGVGAASLIAVAVVGGTWVMVPRDEASRTYSGPWTNRLGLILAIAWPVQWGVCMVVIG
jgi:hypothetical protein